MRASFHGDGAQSVPSFVCEQTALSRSLLRLFLLSLDRSPPRCHFYLLLLCCCSHGSRKVEAHKKGERCEYEFSITTSVLMVPARQRSSPASIASGCATTPSFISVDCCIVPEPYSMKKSSTATRTQSSISSIPPRQR